MNNTKEHIMRTSFKLFLQKSYKEVTLKNILERTALSKGAFYHYFRSKEELFINCVEQYYFKMVSFTDERIPRDKLSKFYTYYIEMLYNGLMSLKESLNDTDPDDDINYLSIVFDAMNRFPGFRELFEAQQKKELDLWLSVIANARKTNEINSAMDDKEIAEIFIRTADGIGMNLILSGKINELKETLIPLWNSFYSTLSN